MGTLVPSHRVRDGFWCISSPSPRPPPYIHVHALMHTCVHAHTRTHTEYTCTHTQTQTHTHTQIRIKVSMPNSAVEKTSLHDLIWDKGFLLSPCLFPLQRLKRASVSRLGNLLVEDTIYFQGNEGFANSSFK